MITDAELFGSARPIVRSRRVAGGVASPRCLDLRENDYVVHIHHGIGVYRGLIKRKGDGDNLRDYILVEYQGGDRLFIPADQIDRIQRYAAADGSAPQVNKIGGNEWQRTTRKVREQAREMAGSLSSSTRRGSRPTVRASGRTPTGRSRWRRRFPTRKRATSSGPSTT